ncbi:MAG: adenine deaminase [Firmicutes bacterium]|nr:adenine deaminase [Bacillota bacterium]
MNLLKRTELIETALGNEKADLAIVNGMLVNVYTGELLEGYGVAVKKDRIAYVGEEIHRTVGPNTEVIDAAGKIVAPGFIDCHAHLGFYCTVSEFLRFAVRGGTTTIATELIEVAFPLGYQGIIEYLESCKEQPVKIFGFVPAMFTFSPGSKRKATTLEQLRELLQREDILGLGETFWLPVVNGDKRLLEFFEETLKAGKKIAGHSAGAKGYKLAAYAAGGVASCHEPITAEEVIERLRLGMYVLAREGGTRQDLEVIAKIKDRNLDLRRMALVTDSVPLQKLVEKGHMDAVLQKAIDVGFDPVTAIQMVTINPARYLNLDDRIGGIAPGKYADIVILPDLQHIDAEYVISNGQVVAHRGELLVQPRKHPFPQWAYNSIRLVKKFTPEDFMIKAPGDVGFVKVRVIYQVAELVTRESYYTVPLFRGMIKADTERDLLKVSCVNFEDSKGKQFVGLVKGFKMKRGALASSMAWDLTNIIAVGADESDMALAMNRVIEMQGGAVVCADGRVLAEMYLPIGGCLSEAPIEELIRQSEAFQRAAAGLGSFLPNIHLTLTTLTTPAIPFLRICEEGLFDVRTNSRVELIS